MREAQVAKKYSTTVLQGSIQIVRTNLDDGVDALPIAAHHDL